jgi:hypothetical protein
LADSIATIAANKCCACVPGAVGLVDNEQTTAARSKARATVG